MQQEHLTFEQKHLPFHSPYPPQQCIDTQEGKTPKGKENKMNIIME